MTTITRKIGLSLGADTCWPICFEDIVADLDLRIAQGKDELRFAVDRIAIEPFALHSKVDHDLVIDRLTYWYAPMREWIKKAILMDGVYTWNNPWSIESNQKHTAYAAMLALGLPIPETWMVPPKSYDEKVDLRVTLQRYAKLFDLGATAGQVGYPCFMKPYDGGGWVGVTKCDDEAGLRDAYERSGKSLMHVQKGIVPFDRFVRCVGLGPQTMLMSYDPSAPLHERYEVAKDFVTSEQRRLIEDITLTINAFFGWDFNSCEALLQKGTWWPIDFANPCPDSQVTSLHYHFPTLVKAKVRWALFIAATKRRMRKTLDWEPYYAIRAKNLPYNETIAAYGKLAREHFDSARFEEFCARELKDLDQVAWEYFGSARARAAIEKKVALIFPRNEWEKFTEHFFQAIQRWRADDAQARKPRPTAATASLPFAKPSTPSTTGANPLPAPTAAAKQPTPPTPVAKQTTPPTPAAKPSTPAPAAMTPATPAAKVPVQSATIQPAKPAEKHVQPSGEAPKPSGKKSAEPMSKITERWRSERLQGQEVQVCRWGDVGTPVLLFPTAAGDAEECERFHLIRVLGELLEQQRIKVYSVDSIAGQAWLSGDNSAGHSAWIQNSFDAFVYHELVPLIRADCKNGAIEIIVAGASIGAYNALVSICRHPDVFSKAICMSGTYDIWKKFGEGQKTHDYLASSPLDFLPQMPEGDVLRRLRERFVLLTHGKGPNESPEESWRVANALGKRGIPNRVDEWGEEWPHDWQTWRAMLPKYADELAPVASAR